MLCTDSVYLCIFLDGEKLTSGELQEFIRKVIDSGTLQEAGSEVTSQSPKDRLRSVMSISSPAIEKFLSELSEGMYDSPHPKTKVVNAAPVIMELDVHIIMGVASDVLVTIQGFCWIFFVFVILKQLLDQNP